MKLVLAIICSFLLAGVPLLRAQAPAPCAGQSHACCHACCQHGVTMPCCKVDKAPDSQPAPAAPAQTGNPVQISLLVPPILIWTLPASPANSISAVSSASLTTAGAPLYARDCALLL
jgi:hypothetical protein